MPTGHNLSPPLFFEYLASYRYASNFQVSIIIIAYFFLFARLLSIQTSLKADFDLPGDFFLFE